MTAPGKKLFVKTYGCQMNVYDSERMTAALGARGYEATAAAEDADLILLNTCHIREKAAEKVYSELGRLRKLKAANPDLRIGVAGCVAQAEGEEILARAPTVDLVVGPQAYHRLPDLLARREAGERPVETGVPGGGQVRPPAAGPAGAAGAGGVPDGAGGVRQVLRLLRRALYPRRRGVAAGGAGRGGGAGPGRARRGRDHAARAERERLSRRGRGERWRRWCGGWRGSRGWSASAIPPRIRTTWATT